LRRQVGDQAAERAYFLGIEAINHLQKLAGKDCGFTLRPSLQIATRLSDVAGLKKEYETRHKLKFPVTLFGAARIVVTPSWPPTITRLPLVRSFNALFPDTRVEAAFAWAGVFGSTKDGLAYIGRHPPFPRAYFALGFGGNGITFSEIAARILTDLFLDRKNEDEKVFRFDR